VEPARACERRSHQVQFDRVTAEPLAFPHPVTQVHGWTAIDPEVLLQGLRVLGDFEFGVSYFVIGGS